jgi:hypothetical protein
MRDAVAGQLEDKVMNHGQPMYRELKRTREAISRITHHASRITRF